MSSFSTPRDVTQNISTHHEFQGSDNFAVTAVLQRHTWRRALHTCCILASVIRARLSVCWCKSSCASTCTHTEHRDSLAPELCHPCHVGKWSEAGKDRKRGGSLPRYARVWGCAFVYVCICRSGGSRWLSVVLQISCPSTSSWPVGDTCGLSGRCDQFKSFVDAPCCFCFFCWKQAKLSFWTIAEAWWLLLNSHFVPHLKTQWCCFSK